MVDTFLAALMLVLLQTSDWQMYTSVVDHFQLTAKDIRAEVESRLTKSTAEPPRLLRLLLRFLPLSASIDIPLSLSCKRIIVYGREEAERLGARRINPEHILMGVVREEEGVAGQILRSAGLNVINMREQMRLNDAAAE